MTLSNTILRKAWLYTFIVLPFWLVAQPKINSPYSRFGFGDIADNNFVFSKMMGGLGASYSGPYTINIVNPASLTYLSTAGFDIGIDAKLSTLEDSQSISDGIWTGNLSYFSLAFPLKNTLNDLLDRKERDINLGMAFTLKPYSQVGYNIESFSFDENVGLVRRAFQGTGGTYDFTWSNAIRYKDFGLGLNLGYLFGEVSNQRFIEFDDITNSEASLFENKSNYSGFVYRLGALYTYHFNREEAREDNSIPSRRINIGLHANSKTNFSTDYSSFEGVASQVSIGNFVRDTFSFSEQNDIKGKLPAEVGIGATYYSGEKVAIGFNFLTTQWSGFGSSVVNEELNNTTKLSFGGYYRPNYKSVSNYFSRVLYRFGAYRNEIATVVIDGEKIDDIGVTVGMSLPFFYQRKISHAHLGVALGIKGRNSVIQERYLKLNFSFTFNDDEWFMKRKYN